jgi:hypothetical protein
MPTLPAEIITMGGVRPAQIILAFALLNPNYRQLTGSRKHRHTGIPANGPTGNVKHLNFPSQYANLQFLNVTGEPFFP